MRQQASKPLGIRAALGLAAAALACALAAMTFAAAPAFALAAGETFTVDGNVYKITDYDPDPYDRSEVTLVRYGSADKTPTVNSVTYQGVKYDVEAIGKNAFNNANGRKIKSVKIGDNVDKVQAKAFYGCKKLKTINLAKADLIEIERDRYGYYLEGADIGKNAFKGAGTAKVKVKCGRADDGYQAAVKKALVSKGLREEARVVK